jgi:NAD(P)-dependent dehydrogenase (short-subunit alcohol dehydrogenase family)
MVVMVTGCSTGFGLHTALAFARRGDRVFATMRDINKAADLLARCEAAATTVEVIEVDVTGDESVRNGVEAVLASAGRIDVLVNNAGIGSRAAVETFPDAAVRAIFETNVFGVLRMLRAVLPAMRTQGSGAIVNVSSIAGLVGVPFNSMYSASKHALEAITEALASEVHPFGIRVTLVEPGYYRTNIGENVTAMTALSPSSPYFKEEQAALAGVAIAVDAGGDPQEVAAAIVDAATTDAPRLRVALGAGGLLQTSGGEWGQVIKRIALPA